MKNTESRRLNEEAGRTKENLCGVPTPFYVAQEVGARVGRSEVLLEAMCGKPNSKEIQSAKKS
ncbi:hypothetical protein LRP50_14705 [Enterovibrio sp. ZSDZ42]|uniref:Small, acid-soluble spore protein, alpha/beta type n=1 Tax=Enterovibrio gelatinilyticus TaxID=2899819 RepID=A0ABT5R4E8_9GAMM|nr:hypothetical protein [Enterovibrio sp. ZSDZ42]MDD1794382.1 hypothetical protein [Enterovibrio sp. ZSDZ42]